MSQNAPVESLARMLSHRVIGQGQHLIELFAPEIAASALPGQFLQIRAEDSFHPFLRRPFSLYRANPESGSISVLFMARGLFTTLLSRVPVGEAVRVLGPLGRPFQLVEGMKRHLLVAGGVGAPPIAFFASRNSASAQRRQEEMLILNGARSQSLLSCEEEFTPFGEAYRVCTDDGSAGLKGRVNDLLQALLEEDTQHTAVYACGPTPMMRAVAAITLEFGCPCQVSMETTMPCGIGACDGCLIQTAQGKARCCVDGPVFEAQELLWAA